MGRKKGLVYGVGINDADYVVSVRKFIDGSYKTVWRCPYYSKWNDMIRRCYCKNRGKTNLSYATSLVVPEWHYFSNFRAWMEKQDWEGKQLDKDILFPGNKVYGPDTCIFVDRKINQFVGEKVFAKGDYPTGVTFYEATGKFRAFCREVVSGKNKSLGCFDDAQKAHEAWLCYKLSQARILAAQQSDPRLAEALIRRYQEYKS